MNATVLAVIAPIVLELWNNFVMPELQKLESQIGSEDLKLVATTFTNAIDAIVKVEVPKI